MKEGWCLFHSSYDSIDRCNQEEKGKHNLSSEDCITNKSRGYEIRAYCHSIAKTIVKSVLPIDYPAEIVLVNEGKESI